MIVKRNSKEEGWKPTSSPQKAVTTTDLFLRAEELPLCELECCLADVGTACHPQNWHCLEKSCFWTAWQRCHRTFSKPGAPCLVALTYDWRWLSLWNVEQFTCASTQPGLGGTFLLQGCTAAAELQFAAFLQSIKHHGFGILPGVMTSGKLHRPAQPGFSLWNCHASYIHALADSIWGSEKRLQLFGLWLYKLSVLRFFD